MKKICMFGWVCRFAPALSFAMRGCQVTGVDIDEQLIDDLNKGITHHLEFYEERIYRNTPGAAGPGRFGL
jgi:UDP-N-acetyl-D-mannosaminuronic acid dehydrogenase